MDKRRRRQVTGVAEPVVADVDMIVCASGEVIAVESLAMFDPEPFVATDDFDVWTDEMGDP